MPEIQFRKYADPAHEQITDLGRVRWRTANNFAAPLVVRIPVGFGKKTGDPWHSVSGEAIYAHLWDGGLPFRATPKMRLACCARRCAGTIRPVFWNTGPCSTARRAPALPRGRLLPAIWQGRSAPGRRRADA